jgi:hypothetical protein
MNESVWHPWLTFNAYTQYYMLALYGGVILLTLFFRGPSFSHRAWFLWRSFFPNWQFYSKLGYSPKLYVRFCTTQAPRVALLDDTQGPWILVYPRAKRRIMDLFYNPLNNLKLYQQNLLDHLIDDLTHLTDPKAIGQCVSYQMIQQWVKNDWSVAYPSSSHHPTPYLQFCVCQHQTQEPINIETDCVLLSPVLERADD